MTNGKTMICDQRVRTDGSSCVLVGFTLAAIVWSCYAHAQLYPAQTAANKEPPPAQTENEPAESTDADGPLPLADWASEGATSSGSDVAHCLPKFRKASHVIGVESKDCAPSNFPSVLATTVTVPENVAPAILALDIRCGLTTDCLGSVLLGADEGSVGISVDGVVLWTARCSASNGCDAFALAGTPSIAVPTEGGRTHRIELNATPGVTWAVRGVTARLESRPDTINGIAYSPFRDCQSPNLGTMPSLGQIQQDLELIRHTANAIRTYSSRGVQGDIPRLALQAGLRVSAGAWLDDKEETNELEIEALIRVANDNDLESVIVGNEVLLRKDLNERQLIEYIERVRAAVDVPVTTAEIGAILEQHPKLMEAVDYYLIHHYAFWEKQPIDVAARLTVDYAVGLKQRVDKRVVIGETGWPSAGPVHGEAVPSAENQHRFLREFLHLAQQNDLEFYYFAAFDELWKADERGVGPHWGIRYADRVNKYDHISTLRRMAQRGDRPLATHPSAPGASDSHDQVSVTAEQCETDEFVVFRNFGAEQRFVPAGWMGDTARIAFMDCWRPSARDPNSSIRIEYTPSAVDGDLGWAGIYWQSSDGNWGEEPGHDLRRFDRVRFWARSDEDGARARFFVGGMGGSSIPNPIYFRKADSEGYVTLSTQWQLFDLEIDDVDLRNVVGGFGWTNAAEDAPNGIVIYLDDIVYLREARR